ncbi:MAG: agmatine deiminase [Anaerolineales bacterium]|nr:agmatine deiminase [Anaerolineales bacterium]MCX7608423.1 agmatine deiminase [Anaerolineales bacterium]MDW8227078.1 agmatine deiminase [Anaerolineales bacterium]
MSLTLDSTPRADGFYMPAEFAPHVGTWMLWPQRPDNWRLGAKPAQKAFVAVARAIAQFEPVTMGVNHNQYANARQMLPPEIRVVEISNNDSWMRDCGPTFVINGHGMVRGIDWKFNAWGGLYNGLYFPWDLDDMVPQKVLEIERLDRYQAPLVLEGGSIHVDGEGTCLTTAECLLSPGRNPDLTQEQIENYLKDYLNVEKVIWIPRGVYNDETTGHVDNLACFLRPGEIALTWTDDTADPQYERSAEAYDFLMSQTDARGRRFKVHKIHQPNPVYITAEEAEGVDAVEGTLPRQAGDRLAASYINFYFCNGGAIVPTFDDPHDAQALATLQELLPERKVVGVPAREILLGGGNIHCITQQQPRG